MMFETKRTKKSKPNVIRNGCPIFTYVRWLVNDIYLLLTELSLTTIMFGHDHFCGTLHDVNHLLIIT